MRNAPRPGPGGRGRGARRMRVPRCVPARRMTKPPSVPHPTAVRRPAPAGVPGVLLRRSASCLSVGVMACAPFVSRGCARLTHGLGHAAPPLTPRAWDALKDCDVGLGYGRASGALLCATPATAPPGVVVPPSAQAMAEDPPPPAAAWGPGRLVGGGGSVIRGFVDPKWPKSLLRLQNPKFPPRHSIGRTRWGGAGAEEEGEGGVALLLPVVPVHAQAWPSRPPPQALSGRQGPANRPPHPLTTISPRDKATSIEGARGRRPI